MKADRVKAVRALLCGTAIIIAALAGAASASAATVTRFLSFTGTIESLDDANGISGLTLHQTIHGTLKLGPMDGPVSTPPSESYFAGPGSAQVGSQSGGSSTYVHTTDAGTQFRLGLGLMPDFVYDPVNQSDFVPLELGIELVYDGVTHAPLLSLSELPGDLLTAYGNSLFFAEGFLGGATDAADNYYSARFSLQSLTVSTTPIPPSLVLLLTALGGLGFVRRRQQG
jgi:hypothetical protein